MISHIHASLQKRRAALEEGDAGFTLIELLVVVLIIGILAAVAIPIFLGQQTAAKDSSAASDAANAALAEAAYYTANSAYTTTTTGTPSLASYGYTTTSGDTVTPSITSGGAGYCVQTSATTGHTYAVSNTASVTKGGSCASGVLSAPSTTPTW